MKTPTRGRFAPLAQVPPIAFLFSFMFLFTLNLNYEKILQYLCSLKKKSYVEGSAEGFAEGFPWKESPKVREFAEGFCGRLCGRFAEGFFNLLD